MLRGLARDPEFLKLWVGETISDFGDQMTLLAIPLTAVIVLKASAFEMGLLAAVGTLPTALFSLPVGVWVDRLPRRRTLIVSDAGKAIVLMTVPIAFVLGVLDMPQLYLVAFLSGTFGVFFIVAYQAYLPALVGRPKLVEANGKMNATSSIAQLAGPSVAGVLVQIFTAPMPVVLDAFSFLASLVGVSLIKRPEPELTPRPRDMRAEISEGMRALLGHPVLRAIVIGAALSILLFSAQLAIFLLYLVRDLALEPSVVGAILAVGGLGALGGAVFAPTLARRIGIGPSLILGASLVFLCFVLRGLVTTAGVAVVSVAAAQVIGLFGLSIFHLDGQRLSPALPPPPQLGLVITRVHVILWGQRPIR